MDVKQEAGNAQARYNALKDERTHFVERGHSCARLTIPSLFQKDVVAARNMKIADPAQSLGARGVNTLSSKLILSLFPLHTAFFKMSLNELDVAAAENDSDQAREAVRQIKKGLAAYERHAMRDIEASGDITVMHEAVKHLIVVGNVGVYVGDKGSTRMYSLNNYVVARTPSGDVMEAIVEEETLYSSLPNDFVEQLRAEEVTRKLAGEKPLGTVGGTGTVSIYTHIRMSDGNVTWHQEVNGKLVPGTESSVPEKANPWLFLRLIRVDGEDYGRSYVESYLGDLESLEVLTRAVTDAAKAATKVIWFVKPNGTTKAQVLAQAPNNSVKSGNAEDVTVLRMDKQADLAVAKELMQVTRQQLAYAFLINTEAMRDAERVTAEEIRFIAQELDDSLGGVYSLLTREFQLPYVRRRLHLFAKKTGAPKLPEGVVDPVIVTGFSALGRGHETDQMLRALDKVSMVLSNPSLGEWVDIAKIIERIFINEGLDVADIMIPEEVRKKIREDQTAKEMAMKLGPEAMRQGAALGQQPQPNQ